MMGELSAQDALFYEFRLEDHVPQNHIVRKLDRLLDFRELRAELAPFYSHTGRPSIDPELMIRMLILGYCFGIRSERRLCDEVNMNLAYRWFCKLGLEAAVPNHSTFSHSRYGRFEDSDILRRVFERIVATCVTQGLVQGETFVTDASIIKANASKNSGFCPADETKSLSDDVAGRGYLNTLNDAAFGAATKVAKKRISVTDPAAQWTAAKPGGAFFAYSTNYLVDSKHAIIMDVEASRAIRQAEVTATNRMIKRVKTDHGITPRKLAADTAYGSAENLHWLVEEQKIDPHIPVFDKSARKDGTFARSDFEWDGLTQTYRCPGGNYLKTTGTIHDGGTHFFMAMKKDCDGCSLKAKCCPNTPNRKVPRSVYEGARDKARKLAKTPEYQAASKDRKKVEMLFAHLKRNLNFRELRLRGPTGVKQEFLLAAIAQNLIKMTKTPSVMASRLKMRP